MIGTVTLNLSVDISSNMNTFLLNEVNRVEMVTKTAGGKGLNVSSVLRQRIPQNTLSIQISPYINLKNH